MSSGIQVSELYTKLGFQVDEAGLVKADAGLEAVMAIAKAAVAAVEQLTVAFAQFGQTAGAAGARAAGAVRSVKGAVYEGPSQAHEGPALPGGYNAALEDEKAAIFRQREKASLREQALLSIDGPKPHEAAHAPAGHGGKGGEHGAAHGGWRGIGGVLENFGHIGHAFLGAFAAHEVMHFAHSIMEAGVAIEKTALKTGLTTKAVQTLGYAAHIANVDAGTLAQGLRFLQTNSFAAAHGGKEQAKAFKDLGIEVKGANGQIKPADALLTEVATKVSELKDPAQQTALAIKIFGRSGAEMLPLLKKGGEGITELREEAEALGGVMGHETMEKAAHLEEQLKRLGFAFNGVKYAIADGLLPVLEFLARGASRVVKFFNELYHETKFLQVALMTGLAYAAVRAGMALRKAGMEAALTWMKAAFPILLAAAAVTTFIAGVEDVYQLLSGGNSQIAEWINDWMGIGTVDEFVRSWHVGIDALSESLTTLKNTMSGALQIAKGLFTFDWGQVSKGAKLVSSGVAKAGVAVAEGAGALVDFDKPGDPIARAKNRGAGASAIYDQGTARTTTRGVGARLQEGSAGFARASVSATRGQSLAEGARQQNTFNIHGPNPHQIAHVVQQKLNEHTTKQNKQLKHALVPNNGGL